MAYLIFVSCSFQLSPPSSNCDIISYHRLPKKYYDSTYFRVRTYWPQVSGHTATKINPLSLMMLLLGCLIIARQDRVSPKQKNLSRVRSGSQSQEQGEQEDGSACVTGWHQQCHRAVQGMFFQTFGRCLTEEVGLLWVCFGQEVIMLKQASHRKTNVTWCYQYVDFKTLRGARWSPQTS